MEIKEYTYCGKKTPGGYSRVKAWGNVVANDLQIGHHRPTLEQLNAKGWLVYVDTVCDSAIEKLAPAFSDDGSIISKAKIKLTDEEIASKSADTLSDNIKLIDQACRNHIDQSSHWTAGPMIWDKAAGGKPKSKAIKEWTKECWTQYFTNKAMLAGGVPFNESMLAYPVCPYDVGEAFQE